MKIKILYEDSNILAIDKPSGIAVHSDGRTKEETITDWVLENYPKMKNVGEKMGDIDRPGIVHRLDRNTSGVLLLAKNQKTHRLLKEQFSAPALGLKTKSGLADRQNRIKKTYIAVVNGWVKNERGVMKKSIGRSPSDFRRWLAGRGARGKLREAVTQYRVLNRFQSSSLDKYTILEVKPKTGRTHQIRVHLKFLNYPVVCDPLYNPGKPCPKGIKRMALHAESIEFSLPAQAESGEGQLIKVQSPLPQEFKSVI